MTTWPGPSRLLVAAGLTAAVAGCAADAPPRPAPTSFALPAAQAERYPTAYLAEVVAAPEGDDLAEGAGEHVVVATNADIRIDLGGWAIVDDDGTRLPLGIGRQIEPGTRLRVHTGCGPDSEEAVHACLDREVLDDASGVLRLLDAGGTEVARLAYDRGR